MSDPDSLSLAVIEALATARGVDPLDLTFNLYEWIDADLLDALPAIDNDEWQFEFVVDGSLVTLRGDGTVRVDGHDPASIYPSQPT